MRQSIYFILALLFLITSMSSVASTGMNHRLINQNTTSGVGTEIKTKGYIFCNNATHAKPEDCDLRLVSLQGGREFEVVDSPELLAAHCRGEKNLEVEVEGTITMRAIMHDDHLKISKFSVLGEYRNDESSSEQASPNYMLRKHHSKTL